MSGDRVAVVTGASAGVGRATALAFAERGFDVALLARGRAGLAGAVKEVERTGARIGAIEVSQEGDRRRLELDVVLPRGVAAPRLVAGIADVPNVADVRWSD